MTDVFLVRHGETAWNATARFQGQLDSPLTARGREQAARLGRMLGRAFSQPPAPVLHVSPLGRTKDTAAILCRHIPEVTSIRVEPRLQEVSTGAWDGLTQADIEAGWPGVLDGTDHYDWYFRSPDGETFEAALRRVRAWMAELDGTVIAVSHGLLGRLVRGTWLGLSAPEMLRLPVPQDTIWHLSPVGVRAIAEA